MPANIFGNTVQEDIASFTVDKSAQFIQLLKPDVWKLVATKHIDAPGNFHSYKAPAVAMSSAIIETQMDTKGHAAINVAIATAIAARYDFPTYYVNEQLFQALQHTNPPTLKWAELSLPFEAMFFMLPKGILKEPFVDKHVTSQDILFIGYAKVKAGDAVTLLGLKDTKIRSLEVDRMIIFWAVGSGLVIQDCAFPTEQLLTPSVDWIELKTKEYEGIRLPYESGPPATFSAYIAGLIANFILVMQARPELVEKGHNTGKHLKNGLAICKPTFIGRKYQRKYEKPEEPLGHFTELRWRAGHLRLQHYGPGNKQEKVLFIDPYICYGAKLVAANLVMKG
jgi:hypothetical protein